jgi:phenylalanyl-tRNA synthetase alpha chain
MYTLTEEGKKYLENGLPEKRLIEKLKQGPVSMKDAQKMEDFSVAIQWVKRNGWVSVEKGIISLAKFDGKIGLQTALEMIKEGKTDDFTLPILLSRKLVETERDDIVKKAEKYIGKEIADVPPELIKTGLWKKANLKKYNVTVTGKKIFPGRKHHYGAFLDHVKRKLAFMGFQEMEGPLVETEFWNMDALFMPQHHSARDVHDAYFVKEPAYAKSLDKNILNAVKKSHESGTSESRGWEYQYDVQRAHRHILRSQCTVLSAKTLASKPKIPGKYFAMARCFRYDIIDATHLADFFQVEGIILDEGLNLRHLVGMLKMFGEEFAEAEQIKVTPSYFPFTEPSASLYAKHPKMGWIELGGAGIFREELTTPLGIDVPVLAWGLGIDRIGMFNMGIKDIRDLFSTDLNYLRSVKVTY